MARESTFLAFSAEIINGADLLAIPADHLQLIEAGFAVAVDSGLRAVHLRKLLGLLTPDADATHMPIARAAAQVFYFDKSFIAIVSSDALSIGRDWRR